MSLMDDCEQVGETDAHPDNILYQLIDSEQNSTKDGKSANVIATNMQFSNIRLNHNFNLTIFNPIRKTSHPLDAAECPFLLELNCG